MASEPMQGYTCPICGAGGAHPKSMPAPICHGLCSKLGEKTVMLPSHNGKILEPMKEQSNVEIERKFLVDPVVWDKIRRQHKHCSYSDIKQGYLSLDVQRTVRVRAVAAYAGLNAWLTVKGLTSGISRAEFEYEIPVIDALDMLRNMCVGDIVAKCRREIPIGDLTLEVDEFYLANEGLIVAEVELESEDQQIDLPDWVGPEVTHDTRYLNSSLATHPYKDWK